METTENTIQRDKIKSEFKFYLEHVARSSRRTEAGYNLGSTAVSSYLNFIGSTSKLFDYNPKKWTHVLSMYDIVDPNEAKKIVDELLNDSAFIERDQNDNQMWRSGALMHYVCFLNARQYFGNVKIKIDKDDAADHDELLNFKRLLEYFCTHLHYIVKNDKNVKGYDVYLKSFVNDGTFRKSGQGWRGQSIQKQIKKWESYRQGTICINVYGSSFQSYATYLHWKGTGHNISANWNGNDIMSLQCVEFKTNGKAKSWEPQNTKFSLDELGLYDGNEPNEHLKELFSSFVSMSLQNQSNSSKHQKPFAINDVVDAIKSTNLIYEDLLVKRFACSLLTKPFVILSGLAGSGKTQLAIAFAKAMVENEDNQVCVVPVGADWTNREPLLGYPNALNQNQYVSPESGVLDLLIECNKPENQQKPYFLILDEMNLSYVERYFADFLSVMESQKEIRLWNGGGEDGDDIPSSVELPKNLFIIGTINVDETTYQFSPKVLDRANVIEFKVSEKEMEDFLKEAPIVEMKNAEGTCANMAEDFVKIAKTKVDASTEANEVLKKFFKQLKSVNAEFGYRSATEIGRFISLANKVAKIKENESVDAAIVQKLLPKLHGSRKKIVPVLEELWKLCVPGTDLKEMESSKKEIPASAIYPTSADKIMRMYWSAIDNGFTSFAEA